MAVHTLPARLILSADDELIVGGRPLSYSQLLLAEFIVFATYKVCEGDGLAVKSIKRLRTAFGLGLREAKDLHDALHSRAVVVCGGLYL